MSFCPDYHKIYGRMNSRQRRAVRRRIKAGRDHWKRMLSGEVPFPVPNVTAPFPRNPILDLVNVQPMTGKCGMMFHMQAKLLGIDRAAPDSKEVTSVQILTGIDGHVVPLPSSEWSADQQEAIRQTAILLEAHRRSAGEA